MVSCVAYPVDNLEVMRMKQTDTGDFWAFGIFLMTLLTFIYQICDLPLTADCLCQKERALCGLK